jgi:hypothetical protein
MLPTILATLLHCAWMSSYDVPTRIATYYVAKFFGVYICGCLRLSVFFPPIMFYYFGPLCSRGAR